MSRAPAATRPADAAPMDPLWDAAATPRKGGEALVVDVDGFEGPLDLLLHLARAQKVDLARISIRALSEQCLAFIEEARALRLELAADYLVMAAWLAYLKSKLLIPSKPDEQPSGEEMAAVLQFRLRRLEAMREAGARLVNRNRLGRDVMARGMPEIVVVDSSSRFEATLFDLLKAYAGQRQRNAVSSVDIAERTVWSLKQARDRLMAMIGTDGDWTALDRFLIDYALAPAARATAIASSFAASLELVREGMMEIRQEDAFAPIYLRRRTLADEERREEAAAHAG